MYVCMYIIHILSADVVHLHNICNYYIHRITLHALQSAGHFGLRMFSILRCFLISCWAVMMPTFSAGHRPSYCTVAAAERALNGTERHGTALLHGCTALFFLSAPVFWHSEHKPPVASASSINFCIGF